MSTETETDSKIEFNERTYQEFEKEKLDIPHGVVAEKERNDKFKAKAKPPIQQIIRSMHRRPIISFDENGKAVKKDFLTYTTEYRGHDWLGNEMKLFPDTAEGVYYAPKFRTTLTQDLETGEHVPKKEYDGITEEYYIELTEKNRKQVIEDIINKSNGTLIDAIKFYYHVPQSSKGGMSFRCDQYTYDQFINSSLDEMERLARTQPSPIPYSKKDQKGYMG